MERDYVVTCINGYRKQNLTRQEAFACADKIEREWREVGVEVQAHVYYNRTGEEVAR